MVGPLPGPLSEFDSYDKRQEKSYPIIKCVHMYVCAWLYIIQGTRNLYSLCTPLTGWTCCVWIIDLPHTVISVLILSPKHSGT